MAVAKKMMVDRVSQPHKLNRTASKEGGKLLADLLLAVEALTIKEVDFKPLKARVFRLEDLEGKDILSMHG